MGKSKKNPFYKVKNKYIYYNKKNNDSRYYLKELHFIECNDLDSQNNKEKLNLLNKKEDYIK